MSAIVASERVELAPRSKGAIIQRAHAWVIAEQVVVQPISLVRHALAKKDKRSRSASICIEALMADQFSARLRT